MEESAKLKVLTKRMGRCITTLINFKRYLDKSRPVAWRDFDEIRHKDSIILEIKECIDLVAEYNKIENIPHVRPCGFDENIEQSDVYEVAAYIRNILRELQTAKDYLDIFSRSNLSELEKPEIDLLRNDLDEIRQADCDPLILLNLEEALIEADAGHHLASGLISARIIDHIIQSIKKEEGLPDEDLIDNRLCV